jgi:CBS domain containing-hemolysin-like protein
VCQHIGCLLAETTVLYRLAEPILLLLLLAGSGFFSGAETARLLAQSKHVLNNVAAKLLNKPRQLLGCLSFGNMTVNVLFFAVSSVVVVRVGRQLGLTVAAVSALAAFGVLVLFGEILPKSVAYANSKSISVAAAAPALFCLQVTKPILFVLRLLIVGPAMRLILGPAGPAKPVTTEEFGALIEQIGRRGLISADENKLITEIIQLGYLKVRDCLRPRVDMVACEVTARREKAIALMQSHQLTKLPVYRRKIDNVVGLIHLRQLLLRPDASLDKLVQKVDFVPEQKTVESLLEFFRSTGTDTAIVVDEYGGIAGVIRLEDIAEELIGPFEASEAIEPILRTGPFEYRLAGSLPIHEWAQVFGIDPAETRFATIAGLVTALLGKIPKPGDVAELRNLKFTVERVRKHRIETVILTLEPIADDVD